ncbi:MAG: LysR family transcriptional regulator [Eubacteriales bacterium]|nr:LysR family transcriptional regulator [Eubacteriales bacterium]
MNKYQTFLKIVELGSFTDAARELNYSQSAISHMIHSLEEELGIPLFIRSKSGLQMTYECTQVIPLIREMVQTEKNLSQKCRSLRDGKSGVVRIATFATLTGSILPSVLKSFHAAWPNINFDFKQGYYREIENWVSKDVSDFGITNISDIRDFQTKLLFKEPLRLVVPSDDPLANEKSVDLRAIQDHPFIVLNEGDEKDFLNTLESQGISLNIQFRLADDNSILNMIEQGLGYAILPELAILASRADFREIPFEPAIHRTVGIIYKNKDALSSASLHFLDHLSKCTENFPHPFIPETLDQR